MVENENKEKSMIFIVIVFMILLVLGSTYALVVWNSSQNTELTLRIGDISGVYCQVGDSINVSNMGPVFNYLTDGEVINFSIDNQTNSVATTSANFHITTIDTNLKNDSFKYVLLSSTDNNNYTVVLSGSFVDSTNNSEIVLLNNYQVAISTKVYFKFIVYIDGSVENSVSMRSGSLVGYLTACNISE